MFIFLLFDIIFASLTISSVVMVIEIILAKVRVEKSRISFFIIRCISSDFLKLYIINPACHEKLELFYPAGGNFSRYSPINSFFLCYHVWCAFVASCAKLCL